MPVWSRKLLFFLVSLQLLIIWLIYNTSMVSYVWNFSQHIPLSYKVITGKDVFHIPLTQPKDMLPFYVEVAADVWCFRGGTDIVKSQQIKKCDCQPEWYGMDCGIPSAVWNSEFLKKGQVADVAIRRLERPRRVISSVAFINEFDLLEIKINEIYEVVDLFIIAEELSVNESSISSLPLSTKLQAGFLLEFQSKMAHIPIKITNRTCIINEVMWQQLMLKNLWQEVWRSVANFRPDDLFLISEISAIPSRDVLLFLKLYSGYSEPINFILRPLAYSFVQLTGEKAESLEMVKTTACTFQFLNSMCRYDIIELLRNSCLHEVNSQKTFESNYWKIQQWSVGTIKTPSGWFCKWCLRVNEINEMLLSHSWLNNMVMNAVVSEGLNQNITNMSANNSILIYGSLRNFTLIPRTDLFLAPPFVLKYKSKYSYLLNKFNATS